MYVSQNNSRKRWSDEKIKEIVEKNYTLNIKVEDGKLYAEAKPKSGISNWNNQGLSLSFKISVPKQINSDLNTVGGSIKISNLSGTQIFKTSGGSLMVENVSGNIVGETLGGSVSIANSSGNIDLKTSGGSITADNCSEEINLKTIGGSLNMSNLNGNINASTSGGSLNMNNLSGNIHAVTIGGSIRANDIDGVLKTGTSGGSVKLDNISGNVEAKTTAGNMTVKMKSVSDYVKLSNSGNINLTLPANKGYNLDIEASKITSAGLNDFSGKIDSKNLQTIIGKGGAKIEVETWGRVNLVFE
jgi:hypothetical protein